MADPRETWQRLQNALQQRRAPGGFPGGGPKNAAGTVILIGMGLAGYVAYNSLYTGKSRGSYLFSLGMELTNY